MQTITTYCPECDTTVEAELHSESCTMNVIGKPVTFEDVFAVCPHCGTDIGDLRREEENLDRAYAVFEKTYGMTPREAYEQKRASR